MVMDAIANRHAHPRGSAFTAPPKNSKGQILDRKIRSGTIGGFNPALRFGIVGLVENRFHIEIIYNGRCGSALSSAAFS
jgi:hypothetical protein